MRPLSGELHTLNVPLPARGRFLWWACPPAVRLAGRAVFSLRVDREGPAPSPPFVVAANHYSHLDPPLVGAALGLPVRFLALEEILTANRFVNWLLLGYGAIPTPRRRLPIAAVRAALARLAVGEVVGVFPEATRVARWGDLEPKRGAAWLALKANVPLVPVAVVGTDRALGLDNRLRRAAVRVVVGRAISPDRSNADALTAEWEAWVTAQVERRRPAPPGGP